MRTCLALLRSAHACSFWRGIQGTSKSCMGDLEPDCPKNMLQKGTNTHSAANSRRLGYWAYWMNPDSRSLDAKERKLDHWAGQDDLYGGLAESMTRLWTGFTHVHKDASPRAGAIDELRGSILRRRDQACDMWSLMRWAWALIRPSLRFGTNRGNLLLEVLP